VSVLDLAAHIEEVARGELAEACAARDIDTNDAGYALGGFGDLGMVIVTGQQGMMPHWSVTISLRSLVRGGSPIAKSLPIPGVLPADDAFRAAVRRLVADLDGQRQAEARPAR